MKVWLLSGGSSELGVQAWSLEHLGFATWGSTKSEVLGLVPEKLDIHLQWLADHRMPFREVQPRTTAVVEEITGHEPLFTEDRQPVTPGEIDLAMDLLRASHHDLMQLLNDMPDAFLKWEPRYRQFPDWADWRTVAATLAHMANAESHYYLAMIGYDPQRAAVTPEAHWQEYFPSVRDDTLEQLRDLRSSSDRARVQTLVRVGRRSPDGEVEEWSVRKALRRIIRHDLLHMKSIQRIRKEWFTPPTRALHNDILGLECSIQ